VPPAQRSAEARLACAEFYDDVLRRETITQLQVTGDGQMLAKMTKSRSLAAGGNCFDNQAFTGSVRADVFFDVQSAAGGKQAAANIVNHGIRYVRNSNGRVQMLLICVRMLVAISALAVVAICRQVATTPKPTRAVQQSHVLQASKTLAPGVTLAFAWRGGPAAQGIL
jgi:hypothetical protein